MVEIDTEHFVVLRVLDHSEPEPLPLAEVRDGIVSYLRDESARKAIREQARTLLLKLRDSASIEELAQENGYEWQVELATTRNNPALPETLRDRAFELPAPPEGSTTFDYVQNSQGDIELFELVRVTPGDESQLAQPRRRALERQLVNEDGQRIDEYYQQSLTSNADISRS